MQNTYLVHHGVKGQRWGVRRTPEQLGYNKSDSKVTQGVKRDYNTLSDEQFFRKHLVSRQEYARRVAKSPTGDPYRDAKRGMNRTGFGRRLFNRSVRAEANLEVSKQLARKADSINASRSIGSKIVVSFLHGKDANKSYNFLRAAGSTKLGAAAVTALFGSNSGMSIAENQYKNTATAKRTRSRVINKYRES